MKRVKILASVSLLVLFGTSFANAQGLRYINRWAQQVQQGARDLDQARLRATPQLLEAGGAAAGGYFGGPAGAAAGQQVGSALGQGYREHQAERQQSRAQANAHAQSREAQERYYRHLAEENARQRAHETQVRVRELQWLQFGVGVAEALLGRGPHQPNHGHCRP